MRTVFLSFAIGLAAGVVCFFISVAFLCFVLLIMGAVSGSHPDMNLAPRVAVPVALLAALTGFTTTLVRGVRSAVAQNK